ncbi:MAG: hypothetical protein NC087_09850 [Anaeroplasma bactoclasticum]|nr:hypothetical protein [Anaeroplasma bactoclasticum]
MFELKSNEEIGTYLKQLILSKYPSCRKFCIAYFDLIKAENYLEDLVLDEIRKLTNRLSQILKGKKAIQTYDLPIFSELLGVSCKEMLSAGAVYKPITNRRTNYNIAFSKNEKDWIDYISREDCIAAYADEFGKTVVDYAIEFKNYGFLKFLIENGYISFVSQQGYVQESNFGAVSNFKTRDYQQHTFNDELYENKLLRTQLITLALENNDDSVLEEMRAREIPTQLTMTLYNCSAVKFNEYYDEHYIDVILRSKSKVLKYFCEEYYTESKWANGKFKWIFPFFDKLIERAVKQKNDRIEMLLDVAIAHNEEAYDNLKKSVLKATKQLKLLYGDRGFMDVIDDTLRDFHLNEEENVFTFYCPYAKEVEPVTRNIIKAGVHSDNPEIQKKIDQLNEMYNKIVDIRNHLIKQ